MAPGGIGNPPHVSAHREVVTNCDHLKWLTFSPVLPHAFTEHGAIMAARILKTPPDPNETSWQDRAWGKK